MSKNLRRFHKYLAYGKLSIMQQGPGSVPQAIKRGRDAGDIRRSRTLRPEGMRGVRPLAESGPLFRCLRRRVRGEISRHKLFPPGSRVLVAVSGGQDSLALAEVLRSLYPAAPASHSVRSCSSADLAHIALAHADHRWPDDAGCAGHVSAYARSVGLPLHIADPGLTDVAQSEAAAREWRYEALASIASKHNYTHVAVGHTRSDLAETLLFNLTTGAGADGLSSLTWSRPLPAEPHDTEDRELKASAQRRPIVARPLLSTSRTETAELCAELGVAVWYDVYNDDSRYARHRTRSHVLPYLRKHYNPRVEEALARTAHLLRDDCAALDSAARLVYAAVVSPPVAAPGPCVEVRVDRIALAEHPVSLQRRVMRMVLEEGGRVTSRTPIFKQVEGLVGLLAAPAGTVLPSLPRARMASVQGNAVVLRDGPTFSPGTSRDNNTHADDCRPDVRHRLVDGSEAFKRLPAHGADSDMPPRRVLMEKNTLKRSRRSEVGQR